MISRNQPGAVAECQLAAQFESLCEALSNSATENRLETHLADWVIPTDRRLPLVFLNWSLRQLLATPFEQLFRTPGVGLKKIEAMLHLLHRVALSPSSTPRFDANMVSSQPIVPEEISVTEQNQVDCSQVSETVWAQWRQRIVEHGIEREALGQFAPSLQRLSRVIWRTPLGVYTHLTLAELRAQKTYGEKRVRAVLEVFGALQGVLGPAGPKSHLAVRYQPRLISHLEDWTRENLSRVGQLSSEEIRNSFIEPLIRQIEIDGGDALADLARHRLGLNGPMESVLNAARRLGFMRARVYQLLSEMATIVSVRWPAGSTMVQRMHEKLCGEHDSSTCLTQFDAARDLFFPELRVDLHRPAGVSESHSMQHASLRPAPGVFNSGTLDHSAAHTQLA